MLLKFCAALVIHSKFVFRAREEEIEAITEKLQALLAQEERQKVATAEDEHRRSE